MFVWGSLHCFCSISELKVNSRYVFIPMNGINETKYSINFVCNIDYLDNGHI